MVVADICCMIAFELMLLFGNRFHIVFLQIMNAVVNQLAMIAFGTHPTNQFAFFEVFDVPSNYLRIHCGAPFLVGFQVNQPDLSIMSVPYHNLLRTDHLDGDIP